MARKNNRSDRRQENGRALRDHQSVFVVGRGLSVGGADGPAIVGQGGSARACGDDRFYGYDQALGEDLVGFWIRKVGHTRGFMDSAPDAMSPKLSNHREAAAADFLFDDTADLRYAKARPSYQHRIPESPLRAGDQALLLFRDCAYGHGDG